MALATEFLDMMPHTVTIAPVTGKDEFNELTHGAAVSYSARIEQGARRVQDITGKEKGSNTRIFIATATEITFEDLITLPSGFNPNTPPILNVLRHSDETGLHHVEIIA